MSHHVGRLIDHVHLKVRDLSASRRFYDAVLGALALPTMEDYGELLEGDELCLSLGEPITSGLHLAFQAADRDAVRRFHVAALAAGGRDNGGPGERNYHPGYYGAFVLDPDGNNIEAVYHGPTERSAPSVVVTRLK
jgi:catechol 2,3-dioxygenase-like lactoylglutathione lyase family enzyme